MTRSDGALAGLRVLDFSTLVPGPLASLVLAEAGADVIRVERPAGEDFRLYTPRWGDVAADYAVLNHGKRVLGADLKLPAHRDVVVELARTADVLIEQFRPGVMTRLGLGFDSIRDLNPRIVYCSITGYGQTGPRRTRAGHDLTYLAEAGVSSMVPDSNGVPAFPALPLADLAGGSYPAIINILLALARRERSGEGAFVDVSMTHNLQLLSYHQVAGRLATGEWAAPGSELLTGGSARYRYYRTADDRHLAVAAAEQKFWVQFASIIGLPDSLLDPGCDDATVAAAVAPIIASRTAAEWSIALDGQDVCCAVVATFAEAESSGLVDVSTGSVRSIVEPVLRVGLSADVPDVVGALSETSPGWAADVVH